MIKRSIALLVGLLMILSALAVAQTEEPATDAEMLATDAASAAGGSAGPTGITSITSIRHARTVEALRNADEKLSGLTDAQLEKLKKIRSVEREKLAAMSRARLIEKLQKIKVEIVNEEEFIKKRMIVEEKLKEAKDKYEDAKARLLTLRSTVKDVHEEFLAADRLLDECGALLIQDESECDEFRQSRLEHGRDMLIKLIERTQAYIEKRISSIDAAEELDEGDAMSRVAHLKRLHEALEGYKEDAEAVRTAAELRRVSRDVKEIVQELKKYTYDHRLRLVHAKIHGLYNRLRLVSAKLDAALERAANAGIDTAELDSLVDDFNRAVESAKEHFKLGSDKYVEAQEALRKAATSSSVARARNIFREAEAEFKEAFDKAQRAHAIYRDIVHKLRGLQDSDDALEALAESDVAIAVDEEEEKEYSVLAYEVKEEKEEADDEPEDTEAEDDESGNEDDTSDEEDGDAEDDDSTNTGGGY